MKWLKRCWAWLFSERDYWTEARILEVDEPRSAGGTDEPENLAFLCAPMQYFGRQDHSCHTHTHAHPIEARREGWNK